MTVAFAEQIEKLDHRLIEESLADVRWDAMEAECPTRLAELCEDAEERAPAVAAWWSGRLALTR
jgi:hypothetical protein